MSELLPPPVPGELIRFVADPAAHRRRVRWQLLVLLGLLVLAAVGVGGLLMDEVGGRALLVVLGVAGVAGAGASIVRLVRLRTESRTGADAIDLVVTGSGLIGPGGLDVPWSEIAGVEMTGPAGRQAGERTSPDGGRARAGDDAGRGSAVVRLMLTDPRTTLGRTTAPRQAAAVRTSDGTPHVRVELTGRTTAELTRLREILDTELAPRGQQVRELSS